MRDTLGLKKGAVALLPHDKEWETEGERTVRELGSIFGTAAVDIRHVGSTSVPTIPAKPIIDIALAVRDFDAVTPLLDTLRSKGYYLRPTDNTLDQLLLAKGSFYDGTGDLQTHFIHVVIMDSRQWRDYLNFKRYLIEHPAVACEYAELKLSLAKLAPVNEGRAAYLAGKHSFIDSVLAQAASLYEN